MCKSPIVLILAISAPLTFADIGYTWTVLAGMTGGKGNADGPLADARFFLPSGVTVDTSGNTYVADFGNCTIRKISADGWVSILAGGTGKRGYVDGKGYEAQFNDPVSVAADALGNLYVADFSNHTIRKISSDGTVRIWAGKTGEPGSEDGQGDSARFYNPAGIAVDGEGTVYVADTVNHTIRQITEEGIVSTLAGSAGNKGYQDGSGSWARFNRPIGIAVSTDETIYVTDAGNQLVRKIEAGGVVGSVAGKVGEKGSSDGLPGDARFHDPNGIAVNEGGIIYVADSGNHTVRRIDALGTVSTLAGGIGQAESRDGSGSGARFNNPAYLAINLAQDILVTDRSGQSIRKISPTGVVSTLTGKPLAEGSADGPGEGARFKEPVGVAVDQEGNVYVGDYNNYTIRKIRPDGHVITLAGSAGLAGINDGQGGFAQFSRPEGVAVDILGNIVVTDTYNFTIRRISSAGLVSTLAGKAYIQGDADGTTNARFRWPRGVALDGGGNAYVVGLGAVRKITPAGLVSTLAGKNSAAGSADGTGVDARFNAAKAAAVDAVGNIFVADTSNHTVRKVTPTGVVTTMAGKAGEPGYTDGFAGDARFNLPCGVAVDRQGTIFVTDSGNHTVRRLMPDGRVSTIGGRVGQAGHNNGLNGEARFSNPQEMAVDANGILYVADSENNAIRKGTPAAVPDLTSLEKWRMLHFSNTANSGIGANGADNDGDGLANILEYALGTNPMRGGPVTWFLGAGPDSTFNFSYSRSAEAYNAGTEFVVEWSDSLAGLWTSNGVSESIITQNAISQQAIAVVPSGGNGKRFVRLKVFAP